MASVTPDTSLCRPHSFPALGVCCRCAGVLVALLVVAGWLRLNQILQTPLFVDEVGYAAYAQLVLDARWEGLIRLFSSFQKPPLPILLHAGLTALGLDIVLAGRLLSALCGLLTVLACAVLGLRLGGWTVAITAASLYAVSPLAVLHERMIVQDGLETPFVLLAVIASWRAIERGEVAAAFAAALAGGVAVQLKTTAVVLVFIMGLLWLLYLVPKASTEVVARPRRTIIAALCAAGPALNYALLTYGPLGDGLRSQNDALMRPFAYIRENTQTFVDAFGTYFPLLLGWAVIIGILVLALRQPRNLLVFIGIVLAVVVPWVLLSRFVTSRYLLPVVPYLCVLAAVGLVEVWNRARAYNSLLAGIVMALLVLGTLPAAALAAWIAIDHESAPLTGLDSLQYQTGWPNAYALEDGIRLVETEAPAGSRVIYLMHSQFYFPRVYGISSSGPATRHVHFLCDQAAVPVESPEVLYALVDTGLCGSDVSTILARDPRFEVIARFERPKQGAAVYVLRRESLP